MRSSRVIYYKHFDEIFIGPFQIWVKLSPLNYNPKFYISHITLMGGELPSQIGLIDNLDYGQALTFGREGIMIIPPPPFEQNCMNYGRTIFNP